MEPISPNDYKECSSGNSEIVSGSYIITQDDTWYNSNVFSKAEQILTKRYQEMNGGTVYQVGSMVQCFLLQSLSEIVANYAVASFPALNQLTIYDVCRMGIRCSTEEQKVLLQAILYLDCSMLLMDTEVNLPQAQKEINGLFIYCTDDYRCSGDRHYLHGPDALLLLNWLFEYIIEMDDDWRYHPTGHYEFFNFQSDPDYSHHEWKFNLRHTSITDMEAPRNYPYQWYTCSSVVRILAGIYNLFYAIDPRVICWIIDVCFKGCIPPNFKGVNTFYWEVREQRRTNRNFDSSWSRRRCHRYKPKKLKYNKKLRVLSLHIL